MDPMEAAYKLAAAAVRRRLAEQHPQDLEALDRIRPGQVAAYTGSYDQAEKLLSCLRIPVTLDPDPKGLEARIVFANCSGSYKKPLAEQIGPLVEAGTWLVSSDWTLHYVVAPAFPNLVRWTGRMTGTEVISVEPNLESLWSEIVVLGADPQWWLWGSYPIEVLDRERVRVEAASHDLLARYDAPVVALRFDWGRGHVFHVISHFWAKTSATPTVRHRGPCTDFMKAGLRLTDAGIERVLHQTGLSPDAVNFAQLQSAATAAELAAQLCVRAVR